MAELLRSECCSGWHASNYESNSTTPARLHLACHGFSKKLRIIRPAKKRWSKEKEEVIRLPPIVLAPPCQPEISCAHACAFTHLHPLPFRYCLEKPQQKDYVLSNLLMNRSLMFVCQVLYRFGCLLSVFRNLFLTCDLFWPEWVAVS